MGFSIIAACDYLSGGIGIAGKLPWHINADLLHFKSMTSGGTVIMGRRTWESIGSTPLPNRQNIVVSSSGCKCLDDALATATATRVFVIGGHDLFKAALAHPDCERVFLTLVRTTHAAPTYDAFFPLASLSENGWTMCKMSDWCESESEGGSYYMFTEYGKEVEA